MPCPFSAIAANCMRSRSARTDYTYLSQFLLDSQTANSGKPSHESLWGYSTEPFDTRRSVISAKAKPAITIAQTTMSSRKQKGAHTCKHAWIVLGILNLEFAGLQGNTPTVMI